MATDQSIPNLACRSESWLWESTEGWPSAIAGGSFSCPFLAWKTNRPFAHGDLEEFRFPEMQPVDRWGTRAPCGPATRVGPSPTWSGCFWTSRSSQRLGPLRVLGIWGVGEMGGFHSVNEIKCVLFWRGGVLSVFFVALLELSGKFISEHDRKSGPSY